MNNKGSNLYGFFPAFFNLSETTRLLHIAREVRNRGGEVVFFSHSEQFEHLVRDQRFTIVPVEPRYSNEFVQHALKVSRFETRKEMLTLDQIRQHVATEIAAYQERPLKALVTGFNFTSSISVRALGIPLVWFVQAPSVKEYYEQHLAVFPDMFSYSLLRVIPRSFLNWLVNVVALKANVNTKSFNQVAGENGVPNFPNTLSLLRGDLTLIGDLPEITPLKPTIDLPRESFVGPILSAVKKKIDAKISAHIEKGKSSGKRTVYFAMGSSGEPELFLSIINYLNGRNDLQSVVAYTSILSPRQLPKVGKHVLLERLVLAEEVTQRVDLAIIHGGHGTVYTQAYSGTPFVGIPMQSEQQDNLESLVRHGCGVWISYRHYRELDLQVAVNQIFTNYDQYEQSAVALRDRLPVPQGAKRSADLIMAL